MDVATATTHQLQAAERGAGWRPRILRDEAAQLEAGRHPAAEHLAPHVLEVTVARMRHEADRLEAEGAAATAELERRRIAAAPGLERMVEARIRAGRLK